jgi:hypothetical protein
VEELNMIRKTGLFIGVVLAGCSGIDVSEDYDRNQDFARLRSWAWAPPVPQADGGGYSVVSNMTHQRITRSVEGELTKKMYNKMEPDQADFWVRHYASIGQKPEAYPGYDGWYGDGDEFTVVEEGTIVVDFISPKDKHLLWRGKATSIVDEDMSPEERDSRIVEAVQKIMDQFPPRKEVNR